MITIEVHVDEAGVTRRVGQAHVTRQRGTSARPSSTTPRTSSTADHPSTPRFPWSRVRVRAREERRPPRALDDVDFHVGVSDDTRQGALRFRLLGEDGFLGAPSRVPPLVALPESLRPRVAAVVGV